MNETTIQSEPKHHGVLKVALLFFGVIAIGSVMLVVYKGDSVQQTTRPVTSEVSSRLPNQSSISEAINGIVVPPEPDPAVNNSTLAGVDSNNNGVRDDVERVIAKESLGQAQFDNAVITAKAYQSILLSSNLTQAEYDAAFLQVTCADLRTIDGLGGWGSSEVLPVTFNTNARKQAYKAKVLNNIHGRIVNARKECL